MKLVTFTTDGHDRLGILHETRGVLELPGDMLSFIAAGSSALASARRALDTALNAKNATWRTIGQVRLRAPIPLPRKNIFCVGRNYKAHIIEGARARGREVVFPPVPEFFSKPPTTVIGPGDEIHLDTRWTQQLDYEVELAAVIGVRCRDLTPERALEAVFGYTIANDVSARDAQQAHGQWFKGKSFDTYCPIGPCIVSADEFGDPSGHRLSLKVNGEVRQDSNTADMLFNLPQILASLSSGITLEPGDIIATGTPSGVALGMSPQRWLQDGDLVEAEVEGIGRLQNRVKKVA